MKAWKRRVPLLDRYGDPVKKDEQPVYIERTNWWGYVTVGVVSFVAVFAACLGMVFMVGSVSRYQHRADAGNNIKVYQRQLRVEFIKAQIRYRQSVGIRRSQDEIAKTLTPLYVGFEMTQALQAIATSGQNNSVIYIPTNPANGLPVVPTSNTVPQAGR